MIKDKLHTITDEDAIQVGFILLKTSMSDIFNFTFEKIKRIKYNTNKGTDAEESVDIYFKSIVKDLYRNTGWKDNDILIKLIEHDRYHNYPYFYSNTKEETDKVWKYNFLSNHIEAIEFLQAKEIL